MIAPTRKSLDEHTAFCLDMARLKLWFAWHHGRVHPQASLDETLRTRTHLWRLIDAFDKATSRDAPAAMNAASWRQLMEQLEPHYAASLACDDADRFEVQGLVLLRPMLEAAARASYAKETPPADAGELGCLKYDSPGRDHPHRVAFHISNPLQPKSIFDDPSYLPRCFKALMHHAESAYGASELVTGTWLNSYPPFTRCFPGPGVPRENNFIPFTSSGDGTWGQFVNARGCFNQKFANRFRETGQLPFEPLRVWCTFDALRRHLQGL